MSEFLEGGNHTTEPIQQEQHIEQIDTTQNEPTQPQVEFDTIKYNKDEVQIPVSERQKYLQQGYYYENKVQPEFDSLKQQAQYLDRLAKVSGYTTSDEMISALEELERQEQIEQASHQLGITPEQYEKYFQPVNSELQSVKDELEGFRKQEFTRNVMAQVEDLKGKYGDFEQYEEQVFDLAINKGYDIEDAYKLLSYDNRINSVKTQAQQEAIQKLKENQSSTPGSLSIGQVDHVTSYSQMSSEDKAKLRERVLRGENITL